jgi:hypothetical protein
VTLAEDAENAKSKIEGWIEDYAGREFFDSGKVSESKAVLLSEIQSELEEGKLEVNRLLPIIENDIAGYKTSGTRGMEGYCHKRYGRILDEDLCSDMPFFNQEYWDWSIPTEVPKFEGKTLDMQWFAVMASLHH